MKLAIGIPTYQRLDGSTPKFLTRALNSIISQTYQDYMVFLIGDCYENNEEFKQLANIIPKDKLYFENLPVAVERQKYKHKSQQLWCSGGVNACNTAIERCLSYGYEYMCHLDHDDYWDKTHLEKINNVIESKKDASFVYTCSAFLKREHLPTVHLTGEFYESYPMPKKTIHSSVCINHKQIPLRYRDVFSETGTISSADLDLWIRLVEYCKLNNLKCYLNASLTCYHLDERH